MEIDGHYKEIIDFYKEEAAKIPLKCSHPACLFELTHIHSEAAKKIHAEWKTKCPKICPKWRKGGIVSGSG